MTIAVAATPASPATSSRRGPPDGVIDAAWRIPVSIYVWGEVIGPTRPS